jgi:hypothetical protein
MATKRLATATVVGAVTLSATGYAIFGVAFRDFYTYALTAGSAAGVPRQEPLLWAVALAALSFSTLLTLVIGSRERPTTGSGVAIGGLVGFLVWFTADLMLFGISNVLNLTSALLDPLLEIVPSAAAGGAIATVLRKMSMAAGERWPDRLSEAHQP